jgi:hypothetical protein
MTTGAVTLLLDDEESMHLAAQYALDWLKSQPDYAQGNSYAFIVGELPDGRVTLKGVPIEVLAAIERAGISFEMMH